MRKSRKILNQAIRKRRKKITNERLRTRIAANSNDRQNRLKISKFLKKYIRKYWKLFCLAILFLSIEALCDLMQPTVMSKIIDTGVAGQRMNFVFMMAGVMLMITAFGAVSAVCRNIISSNVSQKFGTELRSDLFRKIQYLTHENLDKFDNASLVTRLTNDITQVQNFANGLMRIFVKAPLLCIGSIIMAVHLNPLMSPVILIIVPIVIAFIALNLRAGFPFFTKVQEALDGLNAVTREYLSGVRVVKAFNRSEYEEERFEESNVNQFKASVRAMRTMSAFSPGIGLTVNLGIVSVLWFGGILAGRGDMHVGQIMAFINYMTQILFSLMMISMVFTTFVRAKASLERLKVVFEEENRMKFPEESKVSSGTRGMVDFENVYFNYGNTKREPVIKDISFSCMPGESLGIIGSTGSGKSTLVNLIPRFYDVSSGTIRVNGTDVRHFSQEELRGKIALVPQKTVLFTGTIIDNIRWGKEDAVMEEIEESAKAACAHEFICSFPEGYNTLLGQGGVNLSGGQKQRIAIARALIKKPEILILDDCTSAVDVVTEGSIRNGLKMMKNDLTMIIISQRITSIAVSDKIIVMDDGRIAGIGTHRELMLECGIYREIYRSQIGTEDLKDE
jgi:ATP-binding cassette, subfamily B, multidrug efflux pump